MPQREAAWKRVGKQWLPGAIRQREIDKGPAGFAQATGDDKLTMPQQGRKATAGSGGPRAYGRITEGSLMDNLQVAQNGTSVARSSRAMLIRRRTALALDRWLDLSLYGLVASVAWFVFVPLLAPVSGPMVERLGSLSSGTLVVVVLVVAVLVAWAAPRGRWRGWLGVRHFVTYPPLWMAVVIGFVLCALLDSAMGGTEQSGVGWSELIELASIVLPHAWFVLAGLVILSVVVKVLRGAVSGHGQTRHEGGPFPVPCAAEVQSEGSFSRRLPNLAAIVRWLRDDGEIDDPKLDMFGHDLVAQRIARRLADAESYDSPTIAVVGSVGSGKSSIRRLVAHHIRSEKGVSLIEISLWPFESVEAAVCGILRALVKETSRHVNVLALSGLPEKYVSIVEKAGGRFGGLGGLVSTPSDPSVILRKLSTILVTIDRRMVLWIEDLERFSGTDLLSPEQASMRDAERLGPIRALLYLLDRCERITVVVADTSLQSRFDTYKIARFVESPPRVQIMDAWRLVCAVRSECLGGWPRTVIDPADPARREMFDPPKSETEAWMLLRRPTYDRPNEPESLALLLDTPRAIKATLRLTRETWNVLCGEIDFDDILVMSAIRVARPDLFSFIDHHVRLFRKGFTRFMESKRKPTEHPVFQQLEKHLEREPEEAMRNAVKTLIRSVFPGLPEPRVHADLDCIYVARPQGLAVDRHVDYWTRYLSTSAVSEAESDQAALRSIEAWQGGEDSDLVERMIDTNRAAQIETLVGVLKPRDLCRLLVEVASIVASQSAESWPGRVDAPGIASVWRMMLRKRPNDACLADALVRLMDRYVPVHLPLAGDIFSYFAASTSPHVPELIQAKQRVRVAKALHDALLSSFAVGSGARLLEAIKRGSEFLSFRICDGIRRRVKCQIEGLPFDRWPEFSTVLLEAAELDPVFGLPQIVPFVTVGDHQHVERQGEDDEAAAPKSEFVAEFDEAAARRLFDFDRLIRLLADTETPDWIDGQARTLFKAAHTAANNLQEPRTGHPALTE